MQEASENKFPGLESLQSQIDAKNGDQSVTN